MQASWFQWPLHTMFEYWKIKTRWDSFVWIKKWVKNERKEEKENRKCESI